MTALSVTNPTLLDLAKRTDPDGSIAAIVELLSQSNEILEDMSFIEGNLPTGHRTTVRTGLPTPTWRKLYGGVLPTKSRTAQVTESCGMLEMYAEVDKALADLNGNTAEFRMSEEMAFIEAMNQEAAASLIYANEATAPEEITGLTPRYNSLSATNVENMIDAGAAGGQTDNASIWLVCWSPNTIHGIIPKGSKAGIQREDKGQVTIEDVDGSGGRMEAYRTHYRWDLGLCVKDWRYAVRIHSIDKSTLTADASSGPNLPQLMFRAMELIPNLGMGRCAFYMSRNTRTYLRQQVAYGVEGSTMTLDMVGGKRVMAFQDVPVRRVDAMAADEAEVV